MSAAIWHHIGAQFRNPTGRAGALMGALMRFANRVPNRLAIAALHVSMHDTVLELGCGPGAALSAMARLAPLGVVHGLDQSQVMLRQAARRNASAIERGRIVLHCGTFDRLPLPDKSIDKILAVNVAYFWNDANAVLTEMRRVLKPSGRIAIYATDAAAMRRWRFAGPDTHRIYDSADLSACLRGGPFGGADVRITQVRVGPRVPGLLATISS